MPSLADLHSTRVIKALCVGESGTGKTGALASLARAGYNLWLLDYDNGYEVLLDLLKDDAPAMSRVQVALLRDTITMDRGVPKVKGPPHAYKDAGKTLAEWNAQDFGPQDIIVLDTLTTFSDAAFNEALALSSRLNQRPQLQDYGWMAESVKLFIELLTSPDLACHVIVNTHVKFFSGDDESQVAARGLPNARGQQISQTVSRYFNSVLLFRSTGSGPATKRVITTQPRGVVEVKTSAPSSAKPEYPISSGLADLFRDILGSTPNDAPSPSKAQRDANVNATAKEA